MAAGYRFSSKRAPPPDRGRLERSPGGGPEHERLAVAAGEQRVPREQEPPPLRWLIAGVR
jgi:hypothetical protein